MKTVILNAENREEAGKGPAGRLRAKGFIPAVFYGYKAEPSMLQVNASELVELLVNESKESLFVKLAMKVKGKKVHKLSIIKDLQVDTINRKLIHADFYEIDMKRELTLDLPINAVGTPIGIDNGGELQFMKRDLKIAGLPSLLPDSIDVDVTNLDIGDSIKVGDIQVAEGLNVLDSEDIAIVGVMSTRASISAAAAEEAEEGEETAESAEEADAQ